MGDRREFGAFGGFCVFKTIKINRTSIRFTIE